jgi:Tfp pilus assembly protein PilF
MKKGEQYFSENKMQEAILEFKNVIQLEPKDAKAHYKLSQAYLKAGLFREAYSEISKTVELDPGMLEAQNQLGSLYLLSGNRAKAREQAEIVLVKDANNSSAHLLLSSIYIGEKKIEDAIAEAKKAAEGDKKLEAYLHLANLYILKRDLPRAEEMLKAAVKVDEKNLRARYSLA